MTELSRCFGEANGYEAYEDVARRAVSPVLNSKKSPVKRVFFEKDEYSDARETRDDPSLSGGEGFLSAGGIPPSLNSSPFTLNSAAA